MRTIAKWITIIWSIICLVGIIIGLLNIAEEFGEPMDELEEVGAFLGIGCGLAIWLILWAVVALPSLVIWVVSSKKEITNAQQISKVQSVFCKYCGIPYYKDPSTKFCPNCGEPTQA